MEEDSSDETEKMEVEAKKKQKKPDIATPKVRARFFPFNTSSKRLLSAIFI